MHNFIMQLSYFVNCYGQIIIDFIARIVVLF